MENISTQTTPLSPSQRDKWLNLQLPPSILESDPDCARLLITSGIIYPLVGLANSLDSKEIQPIRLDEKGPMLKVQGVWTRWIELDQRIMQNQQNPTQIVSRDNPEEVWSYISPDGFVPRDRLQYDHIYPIHQISETQYKRIHAVAIRFLETNSDADVGVEKTAVLQLMTSATNGVTTPFFLEHCTLRVIRKNGEHYEVYSFGSEMSQDQYRHTMPGRSWISSSVLTTVQTNIGMCDFREFGKLDLCRVTSIPLTEERANAILNLVNRLSQQHLRFNYIQQNCLALAQEVMKCSGYKMPNLQMTFGKLLQRKTSPYLSMCCDLLRRSIPNIVSTLFINCIVLSLGGGGKMSLPLPLNASEDPLSQNRGMISFSRLIRSPKSLLEDGPNTIHHSLPLIDWQLKQFSTCVIRPTSHLPKLHLLPDVIE